VPLLLRLDRALRRGMRRPAGFDRLLHHRLQQRIEPRLQLVRLRREDLLRDIRRGLPVRRAFQIQIRTGDWNASARFRTSRTSGSISCSNMIDGRTRSSRGKRITFVRPGSSSICTIRCSLSIAGNLRRGSAAGQHLNI